MNPYQYRLSIKVLHPSLNLTQITDRLIQSLPGIIPWRLRNIGEERATPKGQKLDGVYTESWFDFSFSEDIQSSTSRELETTIDEILGKFYKRADLFHEIAEIGSQTIIRVGLFIDENSGLIFNPILLKRLATLDIELQLDIWPPDPGGRIAREENGT